MALWNGWGSEKTFINLKLTAEVWPTTVKPVLVELGEDFKPTGRSFSSVSGVLKKLKSSFTPKKGKMWDIYWFKAFIEDGDEMYVIESTITNASKELLNSLINNIWTHLEITVYLNKNGYPTSVTKSWGEYVDKAIENFKDVTTESLFTLLKEVEVVWREVTVDEFHPF